MPLSTPVHAMFTVFGFAGVFFFVQKTSIERFKLASSKKLPLRSDDHSKDKKTMYHCIRWTPEKIKQRLEMIAPLVYRKLITLLSFRYQELNEPLAIPSVDTDVDGSD